MDYLQFQALIFAHTKEKNNYLKACDEFDSFVINPETLEGYLLGPGREPVHCGAADIIQFFTNQRVYDCCLAAIKELKQAREMIDAYYSAHKALRECRNDTILAIKKMLVVLREGRGLVDSDVLLEYIRRQEAVVMTMDDFIVATRIIYEYQRKFNLAANKVFKN